MENATSVIFDQFIRSLSNENKEKGKIGKFNEVCMHKKQSFYAKKEKIGILRS